MQVYQNGTCKKVNEGANKIFNEQSFRRCASVLLKTFSILFYKSWIYVWIEGLIQRTRSKVKKSEIYLKFLLKTIKENLLTLFPAFLFLLNPNFLHLLLRRAKLQH